MKKIASMFKKTILVALVAALAVAALPLTSVFAARVQDPSTPPAEGERSGVRLEKLWARATKGVERFGKLIERSDKMTEKIQDLIDKAAANGKDVAALQAALDAYKYAVDEAGPLYEKAQAIVATHAGFDEHGKVTDFEQAKATLKELGAQLKALHEQIGLPGKALREAIKAFREANPRPTPTPSTPAGG